MYAVQLLAITSQNITYQHVMVRDNERRLTGRYATAERELEFDRNKLLHIHTSIDLD